MNLHLVQSINHRGKKHFVGNSGVLQPLPKCFCDGMTKEKVGNASAQNNILRALDHLDVERRTVLETIALFGPVKFQVMTSKNSLKPFETQIFSKLILWN